MFSSDGWAVMYGGGDFWISRYSFASYRASVRNSAHHQEEERVTRERWGRTRLLLAFVAIAQAASAVVVSSGTEDKKENQNRLRERNSPVSSELR